MKSLGNAAKHLFEGGEIKHKNYIFVSPSKQQSNRHRLFTTETTSTTTTQPTPTSPTTLTTSITATETTVTNSPLFVHSTNLEVGIGINGPPDAPAVEPLTVEVSCPPATDVHVVEPVPSFVSPSKRAPKRAVLSRVLDRPDKVEPGAFCSR